MTWRTRGVLGWLALGVLSGAVAGQGGAPLRYVGGFVISGGDCHGVAFSPNGNRLAAGSYAGEVMVRDVRSGRVLWRRRAHPYYVAPVAFSPDGTRLASQAEGVKVWDTETGALVAELEGDGNDSMAWSTDGALLALSGVDESVELYGTESWEHVATIPMPAGHWEDVVGLAFRRDGSLFVGDDGAAVHRVTIDTGEVEVFERLAPEGSGRSYMRFLGWHRDQFYAAEMNGAVRIGDEVRRFPDTVYEGALAPDGRLAVGGSLNEVFLWDRAGTLLRRMDVGRTVSGLGFDTTGTVLAVATYDGWLRLFKNGVLAERSIPHPGVVESLAFSADGAFVVAVGAVHRKKRDVRVLELATKRITVLRDTGISVVWTGGEGPLVGCDGEDPGWLNVVTGVQDVVERSDFGGVPAPVDRAARRLGGGWTLEREEEAFVLRGRGQRVARVPLNGRAVDARVVVSPARQHVAVATGATVRVFALPSR